MQEYNSGFIGNFKIGDNIVYNLSILAVLYKSSRQLDANEEKLFIKPKLILIASISEAILYDFLHIRMRTFTREGVATITNDIINYVRGLERFDEFAKYIDQAKKHDLFNFKGTDGEDFYDALHDLRKTRNRIHIQNARAYEPKDEVQLFSKEELVVGERVLEAMTSYMSNNHLRDEGTNYVSNFELPWESHFND